MKCRMPNPPHGQGLHLQQKKRTLKHKSNKSGDRSFFLCAAFLLCPCSQLSHSGSEFDQYVEPDMDKAPHSEHERLCKHPGTLSLTHTLIHNALVLLCLSLMYLLLHFDQKKGLETQKLTIRTPRLPPTAHSFSALRIQFISIMEKRKSASTRIVCGTSTNSPPLLLLFFFEGANQTASLTKSMQVPLLKRKRKKKGHV